MLDTAHHLLNGPRSELCDGSIASRITMKLRCDKDEATYVSGDSRGSRCFLRGFQEPNRCGYSSIIEASDGFPDFVESGGRKDDDAGPDPLNASPGICCKASTSANPGMSFFNARICGLELPNTIEDTNPCRLSAPHDLRRSCARLCHGAGGELEQIQFLLGHISVQTTERYVGCKQQLNKAVNDRIELGTPSSLYLQESLRRWIPTTYNPPIG
jgi:hypothetical protein